MAAKNTTGKSNKASFHDRDLKLLWGYAAARCSRCRCDLIADATNVSPAAAVGENAHIRSYKPKGPRYDSTYPVAQLHRYENLILLCRNHHAPVDMQWHSYSVQELEGWKSAHEKWIRDELRACLPSVGFAELEVVAKALLKVGATPTADFTLLDPASKMVKNGLTKRVRDELLLGLSKAKEVEKLIVAFSAPDADFAERLKTGFVDEYKRQRSAGRQGDELYLSLADFAAGGSREFRYQAAARQLLAYLFEKCEVFEK